MISMENRDIEVQFFIFLPQTKFDSIDFTFDEVDIFDVKLCFPRFEDFIYLLECRFEVNIG